MTERSDHVEATIALLEAYIRKLRDGTPPEDVGYELELIWRMMQRRT